MQSQRSTRAALAHHTRTGVFFANQYLVVGVMQARKKYGIKYPNLYAPPGHKNEEAFNCAQRAHQNTVESMPLFLVELVLVGLFYPLFAASCGGLWSVGEGAGEEPAAAARCDFRPPTGTARAPRQENPAH